MSNHFDALVIGAGISGISAAYHFQSNFPDKTYKVLERRKQLGGTWDLFNYPGIRSDSDMYTFGFSFRPWNDESAIAEKDKIITYLQETVNEYGIDRHIEYGAYIKKVSWSSEQAQWHIEGFSESTGEPIRYTANYIFMCVGYYDYDQGYKPEFDGTENYKGELIHPQHWSENIDYRDKKIVVIGSGATAITLIPSLAEQAKHVTMLQRSPTYIAAKPAIDPMANRLSKWFGRRVARWWFILHNIFIYNYCKLFPDRAKQAIIDDIKQILGDKFAAEHYTPSYNPWDQRVCLCPDADFFEAIKEGNASIVTEEIDHFTEDGILLKSGQSLPADIVVTATGLEMLFLGGIQVEVDKNIMQASSSYVYKGFMCNDTPNLFASVGYTNASWTLKVDLTNDYACRVINYMDKQGYDYCVAKISTDIVAAPLLDLSSGYIQRGQDKFPKQATKIPWRLHQNYILDNLLLRFASIKDSAMHFYRQ